MNPKPDKKPKRGRPPNPKLIEQIMAAAKRQFLESGYAQTSMESIAEEAKVSKMTIYKHFESKDVLFERCVSQRTDQVLKAELAKLSPSLSASELPQTLVRIGLEFVGLMRDPEVMAAQKTYISLSDQYPHIGEAFYKQGPLRLVSQVAAVFDTLSQRGLLQINNPKQGALQFLGMCFNGCYLMGSLLGSYTLNEQQAAEQVQGAVEVFLKAYAA